VNRLVKSLCILLAVACCIAGDDDSHLLLKPQDSIAGFPAGKADVELAPNVDGTALSFAAPEILISRKTKQANFISAVWKDAAGQPLHQRDVFAVGTDYTVVVDYIYGKGKHAIDRELWIPGSDATADKTGVQFSVAGQGMFRVQAIDPATPTTKPVADGTDVTFNSTVSLPTPISTVLCNWNSKTAPTIEYFKPSNPMIVKLKVAFPDGRVDWVALSWEARPLHLNGKELKGWAAVQRHGPDQDSSIEIN
jgi:hypothetical protein